MDELIQQLIAAINRLADELHETNEHIREKVDEDS